MDKARTRPKHKEQKKITKKKKTPGKKYVYTFPLFVWKYEKLTDINGKQWTVHECVCSCVDTHFQFDPSAQSELACFFFAIHRPLSKVANARWTTFVGIGTIKPHGEFECVCVCVLFPDKQRHNRIRWRTELDRPETGNETNFYCKHRKNMQHWLGSNQHKRKKIKGFHTRLLLGGRVSEMLEMLLGVEWGKTSQHRLLFNIVIKSSKKLKQNHSWEYNLTSWTHHTIGRNACLERILDLIPSKTVQIQAKITWGYRGDFPLSP